MKYLTIEHKIFKLNHLVHNAYLITIWIICTYNKSLILESTRKVAVTIKFYIVAFEHSQLVASRHFRTTRLLVTMFD